MATGIEWTDQVWNPVVGCTPVSPGCLNCYAATMARRLEAMGRPEYQPRRLDTAGRDVTGLFGLQDESDRVVRIAEKRDGRAVFTGDVRMVSDRLAEPLGWKRPRMVFVNSMSDLFHEAVPDRFIRLVFAAMSFAGQHTYQVLTKRPERMAAWFSDPANSLSACQAEWVAAGIDDRTATGERRIGREGTTGSINGTTRGVGDGNHWPLPGVWLGASVEDQTTANDRIPHLLRCPAAVRFLSCEPLLGALDLSRWIACNCPGDYGRYPHEDKHNIYCPRSRRYVGPRIGWAIIGGESGPRARPCDVAWVRSIVSQCQEAGVAAYVKQLGAKTGMTNPSGPQVREWDETQIVEAEDGVRLLLRDPKGGDPAEWPEDLRVRQFPNTHAPTPSI